MIRELAGVRRFVERSRHEQFPCESSLETGFVPRRPTPRLYGCFGSAHYSRRTEDAYLHWIRRFLVFHNSTDARKMAEMDVQTTMAYTHILNRGGRGVQSPLIAFAKPNPLRVSGFSESYHGQPKHIFGGT